MVQPLMFKDGVQQISDTINEFKVVASGTINVATGNQLANTGTIPKPSRIHRNYIFVVQNKSTQSLSSIQLLSKNNNVLPNYPNGSIVQLSSLNGSLPNNGQGVYTGLSPIMFSLGDAIIQLTLSATTTGTGTIDWVLIGY